MRVYLQSSGDGLVVVHDVAEEGALPLVITIADHI